MVALTERVTLSWKTASFLDSEAHKLLSAWYAELRLGTKKQKMSKTTMHILGLLALMLLALEGASAQRVQPVPSDQKSKPAAPTEAARDEFFGAVTDEDEGLVRRLLQQNPALISASNEDGTALHCAVGHNKILAILLAKNADPNAKNESGETPLHLAAAGDFESAELLLAGGANVNAVNLAGDTPLHMAASKDIAELLVTKGGNIEARNKGGRTPLHAAAKAGQTEIIEYLLSLNADVNAKDGEGNTPMMLATELKNKEAIEFIQGTNRHG